MTRLQPFLIALQFLTILPVRLSEPVDPRNIGRSLLYYPLVGLVIAGLLLAIAGFLTAQASTVTAAIMLTCWVVITGGLHLDGLADSADAWLGGFGDKEKTLQIMKSPTSGPIAVAALVLVLLMKFVMLAELVSEHDWLNILLAVVLARTALPLLFLTTPYVRQGGIAALLVANIPHSASRIMLAAVTLLTLILSAYAMLASAFVLFLLLRYWMQRRLDGTTGDTAGAMVELLETGLLITAVIF